MVSYTYNIYANFLTDFAISQIYWRLKELGDKPVDTGNSIDWEGFRPRLEGLYDNKTERGSRPNIDVIIMLKALFIQQLTIASLITHFFA